MRRFLFGMAVVSMTTAAPGLAFGGDREIADAIISTLKEEKAAGNLKGFDIDLSVEEGEVVFSGSVASKQQLKTILTAAQLTDGVTRIINRIDVESKVAKKASEESMLAFESTTTSNELEEVVVAGANTPEPPLMEKTAAVSQGDVTITDNIIDLLSADKASGLLRNFDLDVSTVEGEVWARGRVANAAQKQHVLTTIQHVPGVTRVVDDISITSGEAATEVATNAPTAVAQQAAPAAMPQKAAPAAMPQHNALVGSGVTPASDQVVVGSSMPVVGNTGMQPQAFAPSMLTSGAAGGYGGDAGYGTYGSPVAAPVAISSGPSYGAGVPRYDNPQVPNHAWPSYAAAPNYSAVTYPKQYSASAWPYIGPFYPYPQVPLGWRKVALEWDDGLWYLDFTSK